MLTDCTDFDDKARIFIKSEFSIPKTECGLIESDTERSEFSIPKTECGLIESDTEMACEENDPLQLSMDDSDPSNLDHQLSDLESQNTQDSYALNDQTSDQLPSDVKLRAENIVNNLMPVKSKPKYEAAYQKFSNWLSEKKITCISDTVLLAYFDELSETYAPTSLWTKYSMLRSTLHIKHDININNYAKLNQFLKKKSEGYISKKALVLSAEHVDRFLKEAPDEHYLAVKVVLMFGVQGSLRKHELTDLTVDDVIDKQDMVLVNIPKTKTQVPKSFVLSKDFYNIYKKYVDLRPADCSCSRFFLNYRNGKCNKQPIGINTIGNMPKTIAKYLKLKDPESYTGHTFRRTSATLPADSGGENNSTRSTSHLVITDVQTVTSKSILADCTNFDDEVRSFLKSEFTVSNTTKTVYKENDPLQLSTSDFFSNNSNYQASRNSKVNFTSQSLLGDNNILGNITKHLRENNSDADNSLNADASSTLKSECSISKTECSLTENDTEIVYEENDPLQLSMNDSDPNNVDHQPTDDTNMGNMTQSALEDNNMLENIIKHPRENNSNADNSLNTDVPSTLITTNSTQGTTLRTKTLKTKDKNLLKKKKSETKSNCLRKKCFVKLKEMKQATFSRKADVFNPQLSILPKNIYGTIRIHCPECNKDLSLIDTVYVRGQPEKCKNCKSKIKFGCKKCNYMCNTRPAIQQHLRIESGDLQYLHCAHCAYKTYWKHCLKGHLVSKHRFVLDVNVHSQFKSCDKIQYDCPKCKIELTREDTANRRDNFVKYCKKCNTDISLTCKRCNRVYKNITSISNHINIYCGKSPRFICQQCNYRTYYSRLLKKHIEIKHKIN